MLLVWWNNVKKNYKKARSTSKRRINFKAKEIISVTAKTFLYIPKCGAAQKQCVNSMRYIHINVSKFG